MFNRQKLKSATFKALIVLSVILLCVIYEMRTSLLQSWYFARKAGRITFQVEPGPSSLIRFPAYGPSDIRLGYTRIPSFIENLSTQSFHVEAQARISETLDELIEGGIFPIYREKERAGITVFDRNRQPVFEVLRPQRLFASFEQIPPIIIQTLLFIENREILDQTHPYKNPAVEWDRLARAILEKFYQIFVPGHEAPGGSTVATQLEKYRHSLQGRTRNVKDKYQQMMSATYRAYLEGRETLDTRKKIVLRYINSIPLAAMRGYGEVNGLGDGLWAWFDTDIDEAMKVLRDIGTNSDSDKEKAALAIAQQAKIYKQVLSLFIAHRRPSYYLLRGEEDLNELANVYLRILAKDGFISDELAAAAARVKLKLREKVPEAAIQSFVARKTANALRTKMLRMLGVQRLYDLDQMDLQVSSTVDLPASEAATKVLTDLMSKEKAIEYGLNQARNLDRGDPAKVIYSFTLYEHVDQQNVLRIQTDNWDRPFDLNEGARMDLGSTAKLRTLVTYLELMASVYEQLSSYSKAQLRQLLTRNPDNLTRWTIEYLQSTEKPELAQMLDKAMERQYSASPGESFFTGGGVHTFVNFKKEDNGKVVTLKEAIRHSINLPFIRLMRDIVKHYEKRTLESFDMNVSPAAQGEGARRNYLIKFADTEGKTFLSQFYKKYQGVGKRDILDLALDGLTKSPKRFALIFRFVKPDANLEDFEKFMNTRFQQSAMTHETLLSLYRSFGPDKYSLQDQGYLARIHPLELWLLKFLNRQPQATLREVFDASIKERQEAYIWLFNTPHKRAQDIRIKTLVEVDAFLKIHEQWKKVGYPFGNLVPSYATAIGSSGDRPAALAELVGIISNGGMRFPSVRIDELRFAQGTPFETQMKWQAPGAQRVMRAEVALTVKNALQDIAENGTARRIKGVFKDAEGKELIVGGKTGTGDHRFETFGAGGRLISSKVISRTATFVFFIGERFYGTITAHVQGQEAAKYDFTSALAVELLKILSKSLTPLIAVTPVSQ